MMLSCSFGLLLGVLAAVTEAGFAPVPHRRVVARSTLRSSGMLGDPSYLESNPNDLHRNEILIRKLSSSSRHQLGDVSNKHRHHAFIVSAALLIAAACIFPSSAHASNIHIPSPKELKGSLISLLDEMSKSGTKGMVVYALSFLVWTMTVGVTTPIETAAGMAFPLSKSIPLSAVGKIGGAFAQFTLAKYVLSGWARKKMEKNEWFNKINLSFQSHPFRVALIWRFSPLPEFVKNVGPALVPTLKTRYQILATLAHGLPFTVIWSCMGNEAAMVARGGQASVVLKRLVAAISWVGLFVSPTLFGWWLKGLSDEEEGADDCQ